MRFKEAFAAAACAVAIGVAFPAFGQSAGSTFRDCPECPEMVVVPGGQFLM